MPSLRPWQLLDPEDMDSRHEAMEAITSLSRELRQLVEDESVPLEHIESRLAERDARIRHFFSSSIEPHQRAEIAAWIEGLLALDHQALEILQSRRQRLHAEHATLRHQARGVAAYQHLDGLRGGMED